MEKHFIWLSGKLFPKRMPHGNVIKFWDNGRIRLGSLGMVKDKIQI